MFEQGGLSGVGGPGRKSQRPWSCLAIHMQKKGYVDGFKIWARNKAESAGGGAPGFLKLPASVYICAYVCREGFLES